MEGKKRGLAAGAEEKRTGDEQVMEGKLVRPKEFPDEGSGDGQLVLPGIITNEGSGDGQLVMPGIITNEGSGDGQLVLPGIITNEGSGDGQLVLPGVFPDEGSGESRRKSSKKAAEGSLSAGAINYIGRNSPGYPARFEGLKKMPEGLYVLGSLPEEDVPTVGIVGARLCSHYGHRVAYDFGKYLAEHGVQVISGLALGIDGYAQEGALAGGGRTFAVMGCGVDICYPRTNKALYRQIALQGGIISEEEPGTPPHAYNFPKRNRIISALSDVVVVVEAREKSGSLITVDFALEQGRSVMAVPGRVGDALSDGCNFLIAQGAGIAWSAEAVLEEIRTAVNLSDSARNERAEQARLLKEAAAGAAMPRKAAGSGIHERAEKDPQLSRQGKRAFGVISKEPAGIDEIAGRAGMTAREVMTAMVELQMLGYVEETGHQRYVEKGR